jgi:hypothetical protein
MKKVKIFFSVLLSVILFSSVIVYADNITKMIQVTYRNISIQVNGKQIQSDKEPFIYQGSVFAPIRTIGEAVDKNVEWDNNTNQVNITDKESNFLSFPLHKIGEKVTKLSYSLTIKKVYTGKKDKLGTEFNIPEEVLFIDIDLEIEADRPKYLQGGRPFTLWDENGNLLANLDERYLNSLCFPPHYVSPDRAYLYYIMKENLTNKRVILVFYPIDAYSGENSDEINVFMAFDLGKIEKKYIRHDDLNDAIK